MPIGSHATVTRGASGNIGLIEPTAITWQIKLDPSEGVYTDKAGTTNAANTDLIRRWDNQGALGDYFDTEADTHRPTLQESVINGYPVISFVSNDYLRDRNTSNSTWNFLHNGTSFALIIVYRTTSSNPNNLQSIVETGGLATANRGFSYGSDDRSGLNRNNSIFSTIANGNGSTYVAQTIGRFDSTVKNEWHIGFVRYRSGASKEWLLAINGSFSGQGKQNVTLTPSTANSTYTLTIGARGNTDTFFFDGDIAFLGITDTNATDAEIAEYIQYLSERFDLYNQNVFVFEDTPSVIAAGTGTNDHNGFPAMAVADNGDLVVAYMQSSSHTAFDGDIMVITSSDKGSTWSSETSIFNHVTDGGDTEFWAIGGMNKMDNGDLILSVARRPLNNQLGYFKSTDNGATWSSVNTITTSWTDFSAEGSKIYEMSNGDWLFPYYARDTGDSGWSIAIAKSTDDGATWTTEFATVVDAAAISINHAEPGLAMIGSTMYCYIRDDTNNRVLYATSTDDGATWSATTVITTEAQGRQNPLELSSGSVINPVRDLDSTDKKIMLMHTADGSRYDLGWRFEGSPNFTQNVSSYGQFAEDSEGNIYIVYGSETGSTKSDIMFSKTLNN